MSRYIAKYMNLKKSKRPIFWNGEGVPKLVFGIASKRDKETTVARWGFLVGTTEVKHVQRHTCPSHF